jgi:glycosyltransferase involved in cell wall biosynthesis
MTIGIVANTYPPDLNGVSVTTANLVEKLREKGVKVVVAIPRVKGVDYPDYVLPLKSLHLPKKMRTDIQIPFLWKEEVIEFFSEQKVDLIHSHDTFFGGLEASQIAKELQIPCVHTYHTFIEAYKSIDIPGYKTFIREFSRQVCNKYDHIIALSSKIYLYLKELKITAPTSQFLNVTSLEHLEPKEFDTNFAMRFGIQKNDFVVITFGRVSKEKGLDKALEVIAPLLKTHKNTKYIIAGHGAAIKILSKKAQKLGIADQVIFAGKYDPQNLAQLCSLAKFFLFTSTTENLPTTLLEAMYCGLPVVAVDDDSVDYILRPRENGLKTEIDKISYLCGELYSNPELLATLSQNAIESAKVIASRDIAQEYIELYRRVIEG